MSCLKVARPLEGVHEAQFLFVNTTCHDQLISQRYFDLPSLEHIRGKVVILQTSGCGTTWKDFHNEYLYICLQLSRAKARGIIFAEKTRGKSPEIIYTGSAVQLLLPPTCVITAEKYDLITSLVEQSQNSMLLNDESENQTGVGVASNKEESSTTTLHADFSDLYFPLDFPVNPSKNLIWKNVVMVEVQSVGGPGQDTPAMNLPSPGLCLMIGPQDHPDIVAEVVPAKMHPDCMVSGYQECQACWSKEASEKFLNSEDFSGRLVWIREEEFATYCLFSYQDYAVELQQLNASAVAFSTHLLTLHTNSPGQQAGRPGYYSFTEITIPTYLISQELEERVDSSDVKDSNSTLTLKLKGMVENTMLDNNATDAQDSGDSPPSIVAAGFWIAARENGWGRRLSVKEYFSCNTIPLLKVNQTLPAVEAPEAFAGSNNLGNNFMNGTRLSKISPGHTCSKDRNSQDCKHCLSLPLEDQILLMHGDLDDPDVSGIIDVEEFPCHTVIGLMMFALRAGRGLKALFVKLGRGIVEEGDEQSRGFSANIEATGNNLGNIPALTALLFQNNIAVPSFLVLPECYKRFESAFPTLYQLPLAHLLPDPVQVYMSLPEIRTDGKGKVASFGSPIVNSNLDIIESQKVLMQVLEPVDLQGLHIGGRAEVSTPIKPLAKGLKLVLAPEECNRKDTCYLCTAAFQREDYDLENQIAFFPLQHSYSSVVKDVVGNGLCLLPRYRLAKMLEDRGASAVIFGNVDDVVQLDRQKGWHDSMKIPILNVPRYISDSWFKVLNQSESDPPVIVYVSEDIGAPLTGEMDVLLGPIVREKLSRSDLNTSAEKIVEGNIIHTNTVQDMDKLLVESTLKDKWAYEVALWGGIGSVCLGAGVVALLIRHYKGRLSRPNAGITISTVNLPPTSSAARIRNQNYSDGIVMQGTYGWGPFRDARSNRSNMYR